MLEYQPLDIKRNEIRLLGLLEPKGGIFSSMARDTIECIMKTVSLSDYSPQYARFMALDGLALSPIPRATLWDYIVMDKELRGDIQPMLRMYPASTQELQSNAASNPAYGSEYNAQTVRYMWGDFDALSYEWGDPRKVAKIIINGHKVSVTKNLEHALRIFRRWKRKTNRTGFIWADAVCINQADIQERNHQVKRMKDLYSSARTVCVSVGRDFRDSRRLEQLMTELASAYLTHAPQSREEKIQVQRNVAQALIRGSDLDVLMEFMTRSYWSRLWVIQEMVLANHSVRVFFGNHGCPLHYWWLAVAILQSEVGQVESMLRRGLGRGNNLQEMTASFTSMERLQSLFESMQQGTQLPDLMQLIDLSRNAQQKDSRDKIYAILGLVSSDITESVVPDYNAPLVDVYRDFCWNIIQLTGSLEIIYQGSSCQNRNNSLPSWLPDFEMATPDDLLSSTRYKGFRAAGETRPACELTQNKSFLVCRGFRLDTVHALGCSDFNTHIAGKPHDHATLSSNQAAGRAYRTFDDAKAALWQTISLEKIQSFPPEVVSQLMAAPLFSSLTRQQQANLYQSTTLQSLQECNGHMDISGYSLASLFPSNSETLDFSHPGPDLVEAIVTVSLFIAFRRLMTTAQGYLGLAPKRTVVGDSIFILFGCNVPLLLRPCGNGAYKLIGECYVHGSMNGEAIALFERGYFEVQNVKLC
jgi:hypothetical protein